MDSNGQPSRELLISELNKLNKKTIIDILVTKTIVNDVTSDVTKNFFKFLFDNGDNHTNTAVARDSNGDCDKSRTFSEKECKCGEVDKENCYLKKEVSLLSRFNEHLEMRVKDLDCILQLRRIERNPVSANEKSLSSIQHLSQKSDKISDRNVNIKPAVSSGRNSTRTEQSAVHVNKAGGITESGNNIDKKRTYRRSSIVGTNNVVKSISAIPKKGYLHVYRLDAKTTVSGLKGYLKQTAPDIDFECELLKQSDLTASFKVMFPIVHVQSVYNPEIWPNGAAVRRFVFRRKDHNDGENFQPRASQMTSQP